MTVTGIHASLVTAFERSVLIIALFAASSTMAQSKRSDAQSSAIAMTPLRDGSHVLDFRIGSWRADITRYRKPFSDPNDSSKLSGTVVVRPIWGGKAELEEIEVKTPDGLWQAASLYLYDTAAHQWSRNYVNSKVGRLDPPAIGDFRDGKLALYSQDTLDGRTIFVRTAFDDMQSDSYDYAEDYSDDGGRTWRPAFRAHMTRASR